MDDRVSRQTLREELVVDSEKYAPFPLAVLKLRRGCREQCLNCVIGLSLPIGRVQQYDPILIDTEAYKIDMYLVENG